MSWLEHQYIFHSMRTRAVFQVGQSKSWESRPRMTVKSLHYTMTSKLLSHEKEIFLITLGGKHKDKDCLY